MRLIRLIANKDSFHPVHFNDGISLIVGKKSNPQEKVDGNTFNGVGKSLIVHLIHFCLASNKIDAFETALPDWVFTLVVEHDYREHTFSRSACKQNVLVVDGEEKTLSETRQLLLSWIVPQPELPASLTFATLLSKFVRRYRSSYIKYNCSSPHDDPYVNLLNNGFLLGINIDLIVKKKKLRDEQEGLRKTERSFKKDPVFRQYYCGQGDVQIDIDELEFSIQQLEKEIAEFKVSSNYHELEVRANSLSYTKKELENARAIIENSIRNIQAALEIQADSSVDNVIKLYSDAQIEISEMIKKTLQEVEDFHKNLIIKRNARLRRELKTHEAELYEITARIGQVGEEMDRLLGYLDTHGALEEYTALNKQLTDLKLRLSHIKEYQNMLKAFQLRLNQIKDEYMLENRKTEKYLDDAETQLKALRQSYFEMAKLFYPKKKSGLIIENNPGENTIRFNIEARIEDDSSDGVNEVKLFCFDMLMAMQHSSSLGFIIHDSRLLANMDPRQRAMLYRVAYDVCQEHHIQYITSINEDALLSIEDLMDGDEFKTILTDNTVLYLNDDSPRSKLLGIQVDIDLEK